MSLNRYGGGSSGAAADLADHLNDTVDAHDASAISFAPTGTVAATTVQAAIAEVSADVSDILDGTTLTGPLVLPDGSAAAPPLRIGDEQNGLYSPAANQLAMSLNGVLRYSFVGETDYRVLGIGSSPTQWGGSITPVNVLELGDASALMATTAQLYAMQNVKYNSSYALVYRANGAASYINLSNSQINFYVAPSGTAGNTATFTNPLRVAESAVTVTGTLAVNGDNISAVSGMGFRNRIINGDMRIDQRYAGAATAVPHGSSAYILDRWLGFENGTGAATIQRLATGTPPTGFSHYMQWKVTTADTAAAAEYYAFRQAIEGVNVVDFAFGSASAKTITLSFQVRSSLTGTFSGALQNSGSTRSYPFTFTISSANTWETKSVTIAGDQSGTWLTDTGVGLYVAFDMGSGSDYLGTAGAWAAANKFGVTGQTAVMGTLNATFDITGVQLEAGSVATPFERRPYSTELALCLRYYETVSYPNTYVSSQLAAAFYTTIWFKEKKRATPTITLPSSTNAVFIGGGTATPANSWTASNVSVDSCAIYAEHSAATMQGVVSNVLIASAEL